MTHTKIKVMNSFLIRVACVSGNASLFFQVWYIFVFCFRSFVCCFSSFDIVCLFLASLFLVVFFFFFLVKNIFLFDKYNK